MTSAIVREDNGTIKLTVTIPWKEIEKTRGEVLASAQKSATVAGFRKGKAPKKLVEKNVNETAVREDILKKLLPNYYVQAVEEHKLRPIMNPKIHVDSVDDKKDWQFTALTCELPEVSLGEYKKKIKDVTAKAKIVIPGKENEKNEPNFDQIIAALLSEAKVKIPSILIEQEADRLLAQTLDEVKRLGLTLDQYMQSTGRTPDTFREEYMKKAEQDITLEFVLQKIAADEKITVENKEIEEAIQAAKNPAERANLQQNSYLLANILRQQKTLDFLKNL
jgi:FKBP-type peptidyl-prolyl cis-trans isomerase (trigger factor)